MVSLVPVDAATAQPESPIKLVQTEPEIKLQPIDVMQNLPTGERPTGMELITTPEGRHNLLEATKIEGERMYDAVESVVKYFGEVMRGEKQLPDTFDPSVRDPRASEAIAMSTQAALATVGRSFRYGKAPESAVPVRPHPEAEPAIPVESPVAPIEQSSTAAPSLERVLPEPEMPPPVTGKAGNLNLDRVFAPDEIKLTLKNIAAQNKEFMEARRGVITHEQTREMAALLGTNPEKLLQRVRGGALNSEELFAARTWLIDQGSKVKQLAKEATSGDDIAKATFDEEVTRLVAIQEQLSGATAEAGRALGQFRMIASASKDQIHAMVEIAKAGGADEWAAKIAQLDDPVAVANFAANVYKATSMDMLLEAWINGLLSGPTTHATNVLSNTLVSLYSIPESAVAAGISKVTRSGVSMREPLSRAFGFFEGMKQGLRAGLKAFRTEEPTDAAMKLDVRKFRAIPNVKIGGVEIGGKQVRIPGRLLLAEDEVFKAIGYRQEINTLSMRKAVGENLKGRALAERVSELRANPTEAMKTAAHEAAARQTFTNPLGPAGQAVTKFLKHMPGFRFIAPFVRTPTNIVKFAGERSPLAPLFSEVRANVAAGGAVRDQQLARIGLGSAVGATSYYLAGEGMITGGGTSDPKKRAVMYANGWQPYSVRIGDYYYSYSRLEPLGMMLGVAADAYELSHLLNADEKQNIASLIMGSVSKNLVSKTWLRGLSDSIEAFNDPDRYGARYIQRMAGTVIPTGVAQWARVDDPYLREARSILDTVKSRIPGQRESLMVRRDVFGQPIKLEGSLGPDLLSPIYQSVAKNDPTIAELLRLDVIPGSLPRKLRGVELTAQEYDFYSAAAGKLTKQILDTIVGAEQWNQATDDVRKELLSTAIRKARNMARTGLLGTHPDLVLRIIAQKNKDNLTTP